MVARPGRPLSGAGAGAHRAEGRSIGPESGSAGAPLLEVRDLRVRFDTPLGSVEVLDGVSLELAQGEALGIVGESGCGKTVTALSVLGLLPRPQGRVVEGSSIRFRGEEIVDAGEARLRRLRGNEISMIFQEPMSSLNPVLTVGEQVAEPLRVHRGMDRTSARAEALRLLEDVRIPEAGRRLASYPHELSGGMRQRVMLAMALACRPALLLADEPTTALDVTTQAQILELIAELRARHGLALVLVTHDLGVVAQVADRVLVMYAGQVVESGPVRELLADPLHPYTRGLLASVPRGHGAARLETIAGTVPPPAEWLPGCRFRPRCPLATDGCEEPQALAPASQERRVRCWRADAAVGGRA